MKRCLCVLFLLCALSASAQSYRFRHYGREQGLSNLNVNCAMQDSRGFVWVGTNIGLNRFDGSRFQTYFAEPTKGTNAMPSNTVTALAEGNDGRLWVGTNHGLCTFDPQHDRFEQIDLKQASQRSILLLVFDLKENLWVRAEYELVRYNTATGEVHSYPFDKFFSPMTLCVSKSGTVWVGASDGKLYRYDERTDRFNGFDVLSTQQQRESEWLNQIVELNDGDLALLTNKMNGYRFAPATGRLTELFDQPLNVRHNFLHVAIQRPTRDGTTELWIGTEDGILIYNLKRGPIAHMRKQFSDPYSLSDDAVHVLFSDREGGVWAGTFFGGMNYVPDEQDEMFSVLQPGGDTQAAIAKVVREMAIDARGRIWVGTEDGGVFMLNDGLRQVKLTWQGNPISRNIQTLMRNGETLWLGTFDEGIYIVDTRTDQVTAHLQSGDEGLYTNSIVRLLLTSDQRILVGTMHLGLLEYDTDQHRFRIFGDKRGGFIHDIYEDSHGSLWVADLLNGVARMNKGEKKFTQVCDKIKNASTLFEDSRNQIWVGTSSNGLYMIDGKDHCSQPLHELARSGIGIDKLTEDGEGRLWISTTDGLYCYDGTAVSRYGTGNGLPTEQFNYNSGLRDSTGRMFFGTLNGLVSFTPSSAAASDQQPLHVLFTGLSVEGREVTHESDPDILKQSLLYADEIHLRYDQSSISIDFACPLYSVPQAIWYRYRLEGLDQDWTVCKGAQRLTFAGLSPGTYTLVVQASRQNGRWDDAAEASRLRLIVHRPWWNSVWAWLVYALLLCALGYYIYNQATRRRREKRRIENERVENERYRDVLQSKIQFFTTITHEIRTPLSLIMGSIERMERGEKNEVGLLRRNAQRLLNLVNQLLDFRKIESSSFLMNFLPTDISTLLREVCTDFTPAARQKGATFAIDIPQDNIPNVMADREALTKILSNLLSNAMKFCEKRVGVSLEQKGDQVCIAVSNDGPRIPHDQLEEIFKPFYQYYGTQVNATVKGSGLGLPLARSLAEMHSGTLTYDEHQTELNRFLLTLPLTVQTTATAASATPLPTQEDESSAEAQGTAATDGKNDSAIPTLLVVDDEQELREFVCEELAADYRILQADNGQHALEILEKENVSLVVTDIMMPVMNGIELCQKIKGDMRYCHIPIVVLTAKVSLQDHLDALHSQADAYIEKPFSTIQLRAQIDNLLRGRELIRSAMLSSPYANVVTVASNTVDEQLLERLNAIVAEYMDDPQLTVELLANEMNMSTSTLYRKVKGITSLSPNDFIRLCRLKKAAELLGSGRFRIKEVAARTGFSSIAYFTSCFMRQFGITPGAFIKKKE